MYVKACVFMEQTTPWPWFGGVRRLIQLPFISTAKVIDAE